MKFAYTGSYFIPAQNVAQFDLEVKKFANFILCEGPKSFALENWKVRAEGRLNGSEGKKFWDDEFRRGRREIWY